MKGVLAFKIASESADDSPESPHPSMTIKQVFEGVEEEWCGILPYCVVKGEVTFYGQTK